jgi:methylated-DNA-[protein]-cysteine S-methyltransferase
MTVSSKTFNYNLQTAYIGVAEPTPLGPVWVALSEYGLVAVRINAREWDFHRSLERNKFEKVIFDTDRTSKAVDELSEYLVGKRRDFNVLIDWSVMTPFQQHVLKLVCAIPYGETSTYGTIAAQLGKPKAARAVGRANATNPIPLIIPCHRVIGSDGKLHGYSAPGGLDTKAWLLQLEGWR